MLLRDIAGFVTVDVAGIVVEVAKNFSHDESFFKVILFTTKKLRSQFLFFLEYSWMRELEFRNNIIIKLN